MVNVGVIGCGYWGPNHIRIFTQLESSKVLVCADINEDSLSRIRGMFPDVQTTTDYKELLKNPDIDAVCISVPTDMHYALTKECLQAGKHVLCEKPLTLDVGQSSQLLELAKKQKRVLMVGHVFLFNEGIRQLKQYIDSGELGKVYYAYSIRTNLGPFRYDVNALWDLAPHDISIFNYLFNGPPVSASGRQHCCLGEHLEDLASATLEYNDNIVANMHVSWLDPKKVRQITVVGDKKMAVWDDLDGTGPVKLYDKHVEKTKTYYATYGEFQLLSKEGSITIPNVKVVEPLKVQGQYFLDCVMKGTHPDIVDAQKGMDVVKTLHAIDTSSKNRGTAVEIN